MICSILMSVKRKHFLKMVKIIRRSKIPIDANVFGSHSFYKIKHNDNRSLSLTSRTAAHGIQDRMKTKLTTDCPTCPSAGLRILDSIASLYGWKEYKANVQSAFLQAGTAARDVLCLSTIDMHLQIKSVAATHCRCVWSSYCQCKMAGAVT